MNKLLSSICSSRSRPRTVAQALAGTSLAAALFWGNPLPAQSLWNDAYSVSLVADKRAHAVGDVLTVLVKESNSASKNNNTTTDKKTALDASIASFLFSPGASGLMTQKGQMPAIKFNADHSFNGGGSINNSETIDARIAVRVIDLLPNGNLVVEGTKKTAFGGETQDAVLRGVVRQEDIAANNTVYSYNLADVTMRYISKGAISDAQRKGWFTRIWEKLTPF